MEQKSNMKFDNLKERLSKYIILAVLTVFAMYLSKIVFNYTFSTMTLIFMALFIILNIVCGIKEMTILDGDLEKRYRFNLVIETVCLLLLGPIPALVMTFISSMIYAPINEIKSGDRFALINIVFQICSQIISISILSIVYTEFEGTIYEINFPENIFAIMFAEICEFFTHTLITVTWNLAGKRGGDIFKVIKNEYIWMLRYDLWQTVYAILISNTIIGCATSITEKVYQNTSNLNFYDLFLLFGIVIVIAIVYFPLNERIKEFEDVIKYNRQNKRLQYVSQQFKDSNKRITRAFVAMLEKRDPYTAGHSERVALYSVILAKKMGFGEERCQQLELAGLLHDVGKMGIALEILHKDGPLTAKEYGEMKKHPIYGVELLQRIYSDVDQKNNEEFNLVVDIAMNHHERWDGRGYPNGISGDDISIESRILALADTLDAMTSDRAYRKGLDFEIAIEEISKNSGTQFCPKIVEVFLECVKDGSLKIHKESSISSLLNAYN